MNPIFTCLLALFFSVQNANSQEVSLDMFSGLQDRVTNTEATQNTLGNQIAGLTQGLQALQAQEANDVNQINSQLAALQNQVGAIGQQVQDLGLTVSDIGARVAVVEDNLGVTIDRVDKLENVNKIWRANFQVVNRTFAELRKKIKFVVPILRIPVVYVKNNGING